MNEQQLKNIVEGALLAAGRSLNLDDLQALFEESERPDKGALKKALDALRDDLEQRSIEIKETASGYRLQVRQQYSEWVSRLWEERPSRYSRALLETLALVAYRQPITRGEIEDVRGVSVSTSIIRTLQERDWIRVVGHRDVPGRPAMYGTTKTFLDYFGLKSLDELPTLAELRDIDSINVELDLQESGRDDSASRSTDEKGKTDAGVAGIPLAEEASAEQGGADVQAESAREPDEEPGMDDNQASHVAMEEGSSAGEADDGLAEASDEQASDDDSNGSTDNPTTEETTDVPQEEPTTDDDAERQ